MIRESVKKLKGYVPGEQPRHGDVIKLNTNENPYPPAPAVFDVLRRFDAEKLRVYPDPVCLALRERIAEMHETTVERVFVGNGSDEALALCTRAFVENEGSIGWFEPSYSLYPVLTDIRAVEKRPVPLDDQFHWAMPTGYDASLFFLTNPNAPTGIQYPVETVRRFCEVFKGVVVVDEAYVDFAREDCMALARDLGNVLVLRTLSKAYSLAGLRVGYVVGDASLIEALFKIKDSYNLDRLSQELALAALNDGPYMRANAEKIVATRERLARGLADLGYEVTPSETNFLWVRPRGLAAQEVFDRLGEHRIMVRYFSGPRTAEYLRITVGTDEDVDTLLKVMKGMEG